MTGAWTVSPLLLLLLMGSSAVVQQTEGLQGRWTGVIVRDSAETPFLVDLELRDGAWRGSFGFPEQRVLQYPLAKVNFAPPNVTIAGPGNSFTLEGTLSEDALLGVFKDAAGAATFHLKRSREEAPYITEDVRFTNGDATLAGSLDIPKAQAHFRP